MNTPETPHAQADRLQRRRAAMPIIDVSEESREQIGRRWQSGGTAYYAWYKFIRPVLVAVFWALVFVYVWHSFLAPSIVIPELQNLMFYAILVVLIVAVLMVMGVFRRQEYAREDKQEGTAASIDDVARYSELPPESIYDLQGTSSVVVRHDDHGNIESALPTAVMPASVAPYPANLVTAGAPRKALEQVDLELEL